MNAPMIGRGTSRSRLSFLLLLCVGAVGVGVAGAGTLFHTELDVAETAAGVAPALDNRGIIDHLNVVINLYRRLTAGNLFLGQPSDAVYEANAVNLAGQVVQLAFQSAEAQAAMMPSSASSEGPPPAGGISRSRLESMLQENDKRKQAIAARIDAINQELSGRLTGAAARRAGALMQERDALQGELDLNNASRTAIEQLLRFADADGAAEAKGLEGNVARLKRSVPELANGEKPKTAAKTPGASAAPGNSAGLIGETAYLYDLWREMEELKSLQNQAAMASASAVALLAPMRAAMHDTLEQGQALAAEAGSPAPSATPAKAGAATLPAVSRQQFDALAARFKQISTVTVPANQEILLLDQCGSNLQQWRDSIGRQSGRALRSVLFHVAFIVIAMSVVLLLSELWRRFTVSYVRDVRRRRQFMLLRRVAVAFSVGLVVILGFVSEFSSLATFAGFITAGLAVGLQTVLLSVAAYFFLVGKWGVRVGDRISISGVTGDVVDVGLLRIYLMELAGTGIDIYPTGRIVVFANSVLFQPTPLFKQLPGAFYAWHELTLLLAPGADCKPLEKKVLSAIQGIFAEYRAEMEREHKTLERQLDVPLQAPAPFARLQAADVGLEYIVRYPVGLRQVAEVDEKVTRTILEILAGDPELKAIVSGTPKIAAAVKN